jgi:hypothetical protein
MNATLFDGGKVHQLAGAVARCGVGKNHQLSQWQTDLGEVTCERCLNSLRRATSGAHGVTRPTVELTATA